MAESSAKENGVERFSTQTHSHNRLGGRRRRKKGRNSTSSASQRSKKRTKKKGRDSAPANGETAKQNGGETSAIFLLLAFSATEAPAPSISPQKKRKPVRIMGTRSMSINVERNLNMEPFFFGKNMKSEASLGEKDERLIK